MPNLFKYGVFLTYFTKSNKGYLAYNLKTPSSFFRSKSLLEFFDKKQAASIN